MAFVVDRSATPTGAALGAPRQWLRLEGALLALLAGLAYAETGAGWGLFATVVLLPDLALIAYVAGPRVGAWAYNLSHGMLLPGALAWVGWAGDVGIALPLALIWLVHIGVDRTLGYGLKYASGFGDTHLGRIGVRRQPGGATMHHAPNPADR